MMRRAPGLRRPPAVRVPPPGARGPPRAPHGLVADLPWVAVGAHLLRPRRRRAAVTAAHYAGPFARALERLGQPDHERRLARAADGEIAHHDHWHRDARAAQYADAIECATQAHHGAVQPAERREQDAQWRPAIPQLIETHASLHCA